MEALVRTPEATVAPLLDVRGLTTEFRSREATIRANAEVSLVVGRGVTLGIVGESGSGKSVFCRSILRLVPSPPGFITAGEVWFEGRDLRALSEEEMRRVRGTEVGMIFQNPMTSLKSGLADRRADHRGPSCSRWALRSGGARKRNRASAPGRDPQPRAPL